jgi:hypothetical protein
VTGQLPHLLPYHVAKLSREHNMVRFKDGTPTHIWYSQHEYGEAYHWGAVEKLADRPLSFSAKGSHANYATRGKHDLHDGGKTTWYS